LGRSPSCRRLIRFLSGSACLDLPAWICLSASVCLDLSFWICLSGSVCLDLCVWISLPGLVCLGLPVCLDQSRWIGGSPALRSVCPHPSVWICLSRSVRGLSALSAAHPLSVRGLFALSAAHPLSVCIYLSGPVWMDAACLHLAARVRLLKAQGRDRWGESTAMSSEVLRRLDAVAQLLHEPASPEKHRADSEAQSKALVDMLAQTKVQGSMAVEAAMKIAAVGWATAAHKQAVTDALAGAVSGKKGQPLQNFEKCMLFFTHSKWQRLLDPNVSYDEKLEIIVDMMGLLGLRHPTEPSVAMMASLAIICVEGVAKAKSLTPGFVNDLYWHLKGVIKKKWSRAPSIDYVQELVSPQTYKEEHPEMYNAAFSVEPPLDPPIRSTDVLAVMATIDMRDRKKAKTARGQEQAQGLGSMPAQMQLQGPQAMQQMMQPMMQQFLMPMLMQGLASAMQGAHGDQRSPLCNISFPTGKGRHLQGAAAAASQLAVQDAVGLKTVGLSGDVASVDSEGRSPMEVEDDVAAVDSAARSPVEVAASAAEMPPPPVAKAQAAPRTSVEDASTSILQAMSSQKADREQKRKKTAAGAAATADTKPPGKLKSKPAATDDKKPSGKLKSKPAAKEPCLSEPVLKPPSISHEKSRSQVLYRSGRPGPGQNVTMKYSNATEYNANMKKAKAMVAAETRKRKGGE